MNQAFCRTVSGRFLVIFLCVAIVAGLRLVVPCDAAAYAQQAQEGASSAAAGLRIGVVKAINGTQITLAPDSGADVSITVQPTTRVVRIAPGQKDLKNAATFQLQDLQVGDRILVAGKAADDHSSVVASTLVVMKHSDVEAKHQQDLQDWQKRGAGGLVNAVDAAAGTVTISVTSFSGSKNIVIHSAKTTVVRRYGPDSAKFDDAKPSTLEQIHPGDQVSARGDRSADGTELTAEEIVCGSFRNIAGMVNSVDASSATLSVHDLLSNKTVTVKITQDSMLRRVPPEMAQRIAMRWKKTGAEASASGSGAQPSPGAANGQTARTASPGGATEGGAFPKGNGMGGRPGGAPDFQQMLNRMPAVSLADLHKGDAVMIVSTEGTASGLGTALKLVSGVEPIFQAAPSANAAQAMMLGAWNLGAPSGDAGGP